MYLQLLSQTVYIAFRAVSTEGITFYNTLFAQVSTAWHRSAAAAAAD
jgi:hypothetical protein